MKIVEVDTSSHYAYDFQSSRLVDFVPCFPRLLSKMTCRHEDVQRPRQFQTRARLQNQQLKGHGCVVSHRTME